MTLSINLEELGVTGQSAPAVVIEVLSRLLSRNTPFIASASYTLRSFYSCTEAVVAMSWSPSSRISGSTIGTSPCSCTVRA